MTDHPSADPLTRTAPLHLGIVQPWDCDVMGHFTVRRYAAAFDDASYQFIFALSGEPPVAPERRLGWADVRQTYDYHAEMRPGDIYEITGAPVKLGTTSVTLAYEMRLRDTGDLVAAMTSVMVRFDLQARKAVPVEAALRERIAAMLSVSSAPGS